MTSLEIYLIMQADILGTVMRMAGMVLGIATAFCGMIFLAEENKYHPVIKNMAVGCVTCFILGAVIPSTKTLALMYAVPRIAEWANSDEVSAETRELYSLAKQALEKAAGVEVEK